MLLQSAEIEYANLGGYLQGTRISLGLDLKAVAEETKITPSNIQAIEENNFAALPAETFTRGFYTLYAKMLSLDPEDVLQLYMQERPHQDKSKSRSIFSSGKQAQEVGIMAKRPSFMPVSFLGLALLLSLFFGCFLSWYFSWNPATYLSQKLRSLDQDPHSVEQILESRYQADIPEPGSEDVKWPEVGSNNYPGIFSSFSSPVFSADQPRKGITGRFPALSPTGEDMFHTDLGEESNGFSLAPFAISTRTQMGW